MADLGSAVVILDHNGESASLAEHSETARLGMTVAGHLEPVDDDQLNDGLLRRNRPVYR
jgi:hypothetical protein